MPNPIILEDLFELNPEREITFLKNYVCIDNYYKNFTDIQKLFDNMYVESWKKSKWSRNFVDYFDCRPAFANWEPDPVKVEARLKPLNNLLCDLLQITSMEIEKSFSFNVFKHNKKDVPSCMQHHPHYDTNMVNVLTYIDSVSSGGTNLYENIDIENKEGSSLLVDTSHFKVLESIQAKPNRCVIFNGNQLHGAYIEDNNKYYSNWRITQASIVKY
tara:strand:+ start:464 stop:1111 length:648 start_codon:yes stop_codon:yes gene_type:complete